jgi:predicted nucleotidyltransferase
MQLRSIPNELASKTVAAIDQALDAIERDEAVAIPLAIESGSRAWGFPSPDSDYDCRFIYVRRLDRYLSPWPARDVIEIPLEDELDVNGWDLGKSLALMVKGNAVVLEWLQSPIIYRGEQCFRDAFLSLARRFADRRLIARHYLHLGERQRRTYFSDDKLIPLKKLFYALRPAGCLRCLRLHPHSAVAPMHFPTLMAECDAPADVMSIVTELLEKKTRTRELGSAPLPAPIATFIESEFTQARQAAEGSPTRPTKEARAEAALFFRETVKRLG